MRVVLAEPRIEGTLRRGVGRSDIRRMGSPQEGDEVDSFSATDCPSCGKLVVTVEGGGWEEAQYLCGSCGKVFRFKTEDDVDGE